MVKFIISPEAQNSLKSIRERFIELAENPFQGIIRIDLNIGYYSNSVNSHAIALSNNEFVFTKILTVIL